MVGQQRQRGTQTRLERKRRERNSALRSRRRASGRHKRLGRTIMLGALAVAFALFWLARELELDREELLGYLGTSLLFVAILIGCGVVGAALLWLLKRPR